jgi:hypothetical protein
MLAQEPPIEGPKTVPVELNMGDNAAYFLDFTEHITNKWLSCIQGVFVSNVTNPYDVAILVNGSNQKVYIPANSQGWYPLLATNPPTFKIWQEDITDAGILGLHFVNFNVTPYTI